MKLIYRWIGTYGVLTTSLVFYVIALLYGIFCLKESPYKVKLRTEKGLIADFFDTKHVFECFNVVLVKGENNRRLRYKSMQIY